MVAAVRVHKHGGPEVLTYEQVEVAAPGPGQIRIKQRACGINFIDTYFRMGMYPSPVGMPFVSGNEAAGEVTAVGPGVTDLKVGDRIAYVHAMGAYAEEKLLPADRAVKIPDGVTTKVAAASFLQGLTAQYLATSTYPLQQGDSCLVHAAAGGVGLLLCQIAKMRGAFVIGTASTPEKLDLARGAGADETINYTTRDFAAEARRITNDVGVVVVYDSVGRTTFEGSLNSLRRRGLLALFGQSSGPVPAFDPQILNRKGSLFLTRPTLNDYVATREELVQRSNELFGWIRDGVLKVKIGAEFPLVRAADAHRALASRKTTGKVVLVP